MQDDFDDISDFLPPPPPEFADHSTTFRPPQPRPVPDNAADRKFLDDYFCDMTRIEALEALEAVQMDGAYIVRPGTASPYCISFLHGGETKHVKIQCNSNGKYFLGDTKVEMLFDTMSQLMDYLTKNVIQGANGIVFRLIINAKSYSQSQKTNKPSQWQSPPQPPLPTSPTVFNNGANLTTSRGSTFGSPTSPSSCDFGGLATLPGRPMSRVGGAAPASPSFQQSEVPLPARLRQLTQQRYYADMSRVETETSLMNTRIEGQFLVRPSKASAYCLSVFHKGRVVHLKIVCVANRYVLEQLQNYGQTFASVPDLIDSLTTSRKTLTLMNGDCIALRQID